MDTLKLILATIALLLIAFCEGQNFAHAQYARSGEVPLSIQKEALRCTVRIVTRKGNGIASGSGVIVGKDSAGLLIATARHVIENATSAEVQTFGGSYPKPTQSFRRVRTLVQDKDMDFALLRVDGHFTLKPLRLCPPDQFPAIGEPVLSVGCGGGSAPTCEIDRLVGRNKEHWIVAQHGTQGRSGGPLVSKDGYVIGCCCCGGGGSTFYSYLGKIHKALDSIGMTGLYSGRDPVRTVSNRTPIPRSSGSPRRTSSPPPRSVPKIGTASRSGIATVRPPSKGIDLFPGLPIQGSRRIEINAGTGEIIISGGSRRIEVGPAGVTIQKGGITIRQGF